MKLKPMAVLLTALCVTTILYSADQYDVDAEITRVQKEIARVQADRQRVKKDAAEDAKEIASYRERIQDKITAIKSETDSIVALTKKSSLRYDSLKAAIGGIQARIKQNELVKGKMKETTAIECDSLIALTPLLPPLLSDQVRSSLLFLKSEIGSGAVDNVEAINRFIQIARDMEASSYDIQIAQGISPVPDIRGSVYRMRIGHIFEAVVDSKGERCAVWEGARQTGEQRTDPQWRIIDDRVTAEQLLKAVSIREGKALPSLVDLPFTSQKGGTK